VLDKSRTPWYVLNSPEIGRPFHKLCELCRAEGVLDPKTKELLILAVSSVSQVEHCGDEHIERALNAGASRQEVTEALLLAAVAAADVRLASNQEAYIKYLGGSRGKGDIDAAVERAHSQ